MTATPEAGAPGPGRPRALKVWEKAGPARTRLALTLQEYLPRRPATYGRLGAQAHVGSHSTVSRIVSGESRPSWTVLEPLTDVMRMWWGAQGNDVLAFPGRDHWYDLYRDVTVEAGKTPEPKDKPRPPEDPDADGRGPGGQRPGGGRPGGGLGPHLSNPLTNGRGPIRRASAFVVSKGTNRGALHLGTFLLLLSLHGWLDTPSAIELLGAIGLLGLSYATPQLRKLHRALRFRLRSRLLFLAFVITKDEVYLFRQEELMERLKHERRRDVGSIDE
ncbi:hypothetical protein [Streptomyces antibioticus]|uniref:hypothetical protein n=1 Tax=Streptomyces antibioticus TaxID=1890 RepID=UPI00225129E7|nr:hypothetical protein [Streptomyces antibioticus]MCX5171170.1 hypothetical protein [Streptomyces antibioticus]